jgi:hypothetical protein
VATRLPSALVIDRTENVSCRTPPAAMVAYARATSIGWGELGPRTLEGVAVRSAVVLGYPAQRATSIVCCAPALRLRATYTVLTESSVALTRSIIPNCSLSKLVTGALKPGKRCGLCPSNRLLRLRLSASGAWGSQSPGRRRPSRAAIRPKGLKVEPAGTRSCVTPFCAREPSPA